MKKVLIHSTVCFIIISMFSSCDNKENDKKQKTEQETGFEIYEVFNTYKDTDAPFLNLRVEANSDSKIIAELYDGTQLYLLAKKYGEDGNWSKVKVIETKEIGFVNGHWIHKVLIEDAPKTEISDASELYQKVKKKSIEVKFHGIGTEPFWDLYVLEDEVLYAINEEPQSYRLLTPFDNSAYSQKIKYESNDGTVYEVKLVNDPAGDGMSDRTYPYSVIFSEEEPWYNGAGDSRHMTNWSLYE